MREIEIKRALLRLLIRWFLKSENGIKLICVRVLGANHVIVTGRWMLKLVLNIKWFLLLCFLNSVVKCILGHLQDLEKIGWLQHKTCPAIGSSFWYSRKNNKQLIQHSTSISKFDDLTKWHYPGISTSPSMKFLKVKGC